MNETQQMFTHNAGLCQPSTSATKPTTAQVNLENVQDFSNVCRTCATITEFVIPIFAGEGLQNNLADKIHSHLPIKVTETDVLPRVVCYQCASTLLAWHELVACCRHADAALRTRLTADPSIQTDKDQKLINTKTNLTSEEDAQSKSKETKNCLSRSVKSETLSISPTAIVNQSSAPLLKSIAAPIRPSLLVKSAAPPIQVMPPLIQTIASRFPVMAPPVRFVTHTTQPMMIPGRSIASQTPTSTRQLPKYAHRNCEYCNIMYSEDKYYQHMVSNHSELVFFCEECNRFISKTVLVIHMSLHAYGYIPKIDVDCKKGQAIDVNQDAVQISTLEKVDAALTAQISKTSKSKPENEFSDHSDVENAFDPIPESVFEAIEDSQDTQTSDTRQTPEREHFGSKSDISIPSKENSKKSNKKSQICPICSRKFSASSSFFYHMKFTHKKVKEHECDVCFRKFATRASLAAHLPIHTGERQFECKECKKCFRSKASLYIHEQIHNGIKNMSCTLCHMSFRWKTHLARHMKRHSAEKVHLCATCGRGFSVRYDLMRHVRTHTAGKFACEECSLVFAQLRYLKTHINKKHPTKCDTN